MAITTTALITETSTSNFQTWTTSSFTPTSGAILVVAHFGSLLSGAITWGITDSESLTWNVIDTTTQTNVTGACQARAWWTHITAGSPPAMTVSIEMNAVTNHEPGTIVWEWTGTINTSSPIAQTGDAIKDEASPPDTNDSHTTATLGALSEAAVAAFFLQVPSTGTRTWDAAPTDWTRLQDDTGYWTMTCLNEADNTTETSCTQGRGGTGESYAWHSFIVEPNASGPAGGIVIPRTSPARAHILTR